MKRSRPVTRPWPGEHIRVGLVFDQRMSKFHNGKIDGGTWRVRSQSVMDAPLSVDVIKLPDGRKVLLMNVAKLLRVGDLCNPRKLALDYHDWLRAEKARILAETFGGVTAKGMTFEVTTSTECSATMKVEARS